MAAMSTILCRFTKALISGLIRSNKEGSLAAEDVHAVIKEIADVFMPLQVELHRRREEIIFTDDPDVDVLRAHEKLCDSYLVISDALLEGVQYLKDEAAKLESEEE
jgi:hypothetical protein